MRIIYVTACMPYGRAETFIISEIRELLHKNEVLVVPRSPGQLGKHAAWLAAHTKREGLLSWRVLTASLRVAVKNPRLAATNFRVLLRSGNTKTLLGNLAVFSKGLWLARVAAEWKADHIHCHWAGTTATMTMIASRQSGIPWSLTAHRSDIVSNNLLREKMASAVAVRAIAQEGRRMMIERGVPDRDTLRVLPMGVEIPPASTSINSSQKVILCAADLLEVKGHRFLIDAWKIIRDKGIEAQLWLAGSGELQVELRNQAERLGLADSIRFLGTLKHDSLLGLYRTGKVTGVVLASVDLGGGCHEGIPVALVEAMSYGVPVVATATGGIPELVQPGTGLLVPAEDPEALANALEGILQNERLAHEVGRAGRRWVASTRDIRHIAAELEKMFASSGRESGTRTRSSHASKDAELAATAEAK
jgi:colanic acid/amylovoran biosynthesis glycosyltransferase